jgi:pimeloyl-ACP methyl ester carboxylesterase
MGSGPVVLVCHGTSQNCMSADGLNPLLQAGFQVLIPSRPGYGHTPLSAGRTAAQAAETLTALLDSLEIQTCSVLAISGGGPTGVALAANYPERVKRLVLSTAITRTEGRQDEPAYESQKSFYGPLHGLTWGMLRLVSNLSPQSMARQTMAIFSTHDPDEALSRLTAQDVALIRHFYQGQSSRQGALNDLTHTVGVDLLQAVTQPVLVVHSREDKSVPFSHAEWALEHIPQAELCESGFSGHFIWVGPDYPAISQRMVSFLQAG